VTCITARTLIAVAGLGLALLWAPPDSDAQPAGKIPRIGILRQGSPPDPLVGTFLRGLREFGYAEGRNVHIEYRWAEGNVERLPDLAAELVRLKVDVIVAAGVEALDVKRTTGSIPIVMPASSDPVRLGLVASLARPDGNVTGLASLFDEMVGKWVELLKEALPGTSRMAVLRYPEVDPDLTQVRASDAAARSLGVRLYVLNVSRADDLANAFAEARKESSGSSLRLSVRIPLRASSSDH
jgi:ABC-type uncharacterized transport system substrate-binding protein